MSTAVGVQHVDYALRGLEHIPELAERAMSGCRPDLVEPILPPDGVAHIHEDWPMRR
jgi:hypothetical protein